MALSPYREQEKTLFELGKKDEIFGADQLRSIPGISGRPTRMPSLEEGESVICGYDQGLGERMIVCESVEDMQQLFDAYAGGGALRIAWYAGKDPGFVTVIAG